MPGGLVRIEYYDGGTGKVPVSRYLRLRAVVVP
jgi:hypothetical protein